MRVTESIFNKNNRLENKKHQKKDINDEPDHMEMEARRVAGKWFSDEKLASTFKSKMDEGINSAPSVFERGTVFHVDRDSY
ncbi:MAG: hypothetical protein MJ131_07900 [Lachnospiraceae bacterium]|nr:hypothetical protein [Lachnospiraceae bacterium]